MQASNIFERLFGDDGYRYRCVEDVFKALDVDKDGILSVMEFRSLLQRLFQGSLSIEQEQRLRELLIQEKRGIKKKIDLACFKALWHYWVLKVLQPKTALLIIDVQNDFVSGSLALRNCSAGQDGAEVIPVINSLLDRCCFDLVVYSKDWHPPDHISFFSNRHRYKVSEASKVTRDEARLNDELTYELGPVGPVTQKLWPVHCVQKSEGAELCPELRSVPNAVTINKGECSSMDSYSAFWDNNKCSETRLIRELHSSGINLVFVCGLALDFCVGFTALDSLEHGLATVVVRDACRGVDTNGINCMLDELKQKGVLLADSSEVPDMQSGKERRVQLAMQTAAEFAARGASLVHQKSL